MYLLTEKTLPLFTKQQHGENMKHKKHLKDIRRKVRTQLLDKSAYSWLSQNLTLLEEYFYAEPYSKLIRVL